MEELFEFDEDERDCVDFMDELELECEDYYIEEEDFEQ